ncbi:hypothetical protein Tco_1136369 [Tanacetum coccineum]
MDEANLTIEEYIELEAKKARRRGQTFNWETDTCGKIRYHEHINYFKDFESDFLAIVFDDPLTTDHKISSKPTVRPLDTNEIDFRISFDKSDDKDYICIYDKNLFSYKLISINDLKTDSKNGIDEVSIPPNDVVIKQMDSGIDYNIDTQSHEFDEDFETNHDIHREPSNMEDYLIIIKVVIQKRFHEGMPLVFIIKNLYVPFGIPFEPKRFYKDGVCMRKNYEGQVLTEKMDQAVMARLRIDYTGDDGHVVFTSHAWKRMFEVCSSLIRELMLEFFNTCRFTDIELRLEVAATFCFQLGGVRRQMSWREFILALGLHTAEEMANKGFGAY